MENKSYSVEIKVDGKKFVRTVETTKDMFAMNELLQLIGASLDKHGISFEHEFKPETEV